MNDRNNWHLMSADEVAAALKTDRFKGLEKRAASRRLRGLGENSVWRVRRTQLSDIVRSTVFDLATVLLVISTAAAAMFEMSAVAVSMLVILIIASIVRITAYVRASLILDRTAEEKIPVFTVIRDGKAAVVRAGELVKGDIVYIEAGDTVPCDGRVVSASDSIVFEEEITENRGGVHKFDTVIKTESDSAAVPVEYRSNMVFAGSEVKSGKLRIIATATGEDTLIVRRLGGIVIDTSGELPSVERLSKQSRLMSLVMLGFVMLITVISLFVGDEFTLPEVFLCVMAMATATMSELLTAIGYIIVAASVYEASASEGESKKSLLSYFLHGKKHPKITLRAPAAIDKVASAERIVFTGTSYFKSGRTELFAYRAGGALASGRVKPKSKGDTALVELLVLATASAASGGIGLAADSDPHGTSHSKEYTLISRAIEAYTRSTKKRVPTPTPLSHVSSGDPQASGMDISIIELGGELYYVSSGPIDAVLRSCTTEKTEGGSVPLSPDAVRRIYTECAKLEFGGAKVVAVAKKPSETSTLGRLSEVTRDMTFIGFLAVTEESESGARESVAFIKERGITPILFTSSPKEDLYYCHRIGLFNKNTKVIPISALSDDYDSDAADGVIVSFEGIEESKIGAAYSVAMDKLSRGRSTAFVAKNKAFASAFAKADVGFAVSRYALRPIPEALSRNAAALIYPAKSETGHEYGGISGVVYAMRLASRARHNTDSARFYLTASQLARLVLILAAVIFRLPMPSPVFILIWGLLLDFAAVLSMAFDGDTHGRDPMPRGNLWAVILGLLTGALSSLAVPIAGAASSAFPLPSTDGGYVSVLCASVVFASLVLSFHARGRGSLFRSRGQCRSFVAFVIAGAVFALLIMLTDSVSTLCGGSPCGALAVFALIPALVLLAVLEVAKLIFKKRGMAEK